MNHATLLVPPKPVGPRFREASESGEEDEEEQKEEEKKTETEDEEEEDRAAEEQDLREARSFRWAWSWSWSWKSGGTRTGRSMFDPCGSSGSGGSSEGSSETSSWKDELGVDLGSESELVFGTSSLTSDGQKEWWKCWSLGGCCDGHFSDEEAFRSWIWQLGRHWRFVAMFCTFGGQFLAQCWLWWQVAQHKKIWDWPSWVFGVAALLTTSLPLTLWFVFERCGWESKASSHQVRLIFWCHWLGAVGLMMTRVTGASRFKESPEIYEIWMCVFYFVSVQTICWRVAMAEDALKLRGFARHTLKMWIVGALSFLFVPVQVYIYFKRAQQCAIYMDKWLDIYTLFASILIGGLCWNRFSCMIGDITAASSTLRRKRYLLSEAQWAASCLRQVRCGLLMLSITSAFASIMRLNNAGEWANDWIDLLLVPNNLCCISEFVSLLFTVQFFHPHKPGAVNLHAVPIVARRGTGEQLQPQLISTAPTAKWRVASPEHSLEWNRMVHTLATRYIEAGELLDFFISIPKLMPHFDCNCHTTNDVVRAAIIPGSAQLHQSRCSSDESKLLGHAYTDRLRSGRAQRDTRNGVAEAVFAQRMVTHDWRNLFLHLVAAVLADALGKDEYASTANKLRSKAGLTRLRTRLKHGNRHVTRYWICAFCVNQHSGICASFGVEPDLSSPEHSRYKANSVDTLTGNPHPSCPCQEQKHWSGDKCEMNKFDEVMALLNLQVPELCQVVAIDRKLELFSRVWCVAELVQASHSKIPQNVCLLSKALLDPDHGDLGVYLKLATLSVADCSAARNADKELILSKIEQMWGIEEFDARLQATIFGPHGLLGKKLLGFDVIYSASRVVARVKAFSANAAADAAESTSTSSSSSELEGHEDAQMALAGVVSECERLKSVST